MRENYVDCRTRTAVVLYLGLAFPLFEPDEGRYAERWRPFWSSCWRWRCCGTPLLVPPDKQRHPPTPCYVCAGEQSTPFCRRKSLCHQARSTLLTCLLK
jgi:hypothetical protein